MGLFHRKDDLKARVRSLEDALGLFYVKAETKDEYDEHKMESGSYSLIPRLVKDVKKLTDKAEGKK